MTGSELFGVLLRLVSDNKINGVGVQIRQQ